MVSFSSSSLLFWINLFQSLSLSASTSWLHFDFSLENWLELYFFLFVFNLFYLNGTTYWCYGIIIRSCFPISTSPLAMVRSEYLPLTVGMQAKQGPPFFFFNVIHHTCLCRGLLYLLYVVSRTATNIVAFINWALLWQKGLFLLFNVSYYLIGLQTNMPRMQQWRAVFFFLCLEWPLWILLSFSTWQVEPIVIGTLLQTLFSMLFPQHWQLAAGQSQGSEGRGPFRGRGGGGLAGSENRVSVLWRH